VVALTYRATVDVPARFTDPSPSVLGEAVMRSAAFVAGVDDVRSGRAPDYDAYCFSLFQWNKEL
jgi:hypothetical protein